MSTFAAFLIPSALLSRCNVRFLSDAHSGLALLLSIVALYLLVYLQNNLRERVIDILARFGGNFNVAEPFLLGVCRGFLVSDLSVW